MKCVVTGASGYIGSVLCKKLKEYGHYVISVDVAPYALKYTDEHWNTCFSDSQFLENVVSQDADAIFHLAAHSLLGPSAYNPLPYFINNAARTAEMLNFLMAHDWKGKLVFSSTAAVYGEQPFMVSEISPKEPINYYGLSKLHAEDIIKAANKVHGLDAVIFRYFNVSGAYQDVGQRRNEPHILTQMSKAAKTGQKFKIYGGDYNTKDGTCIRDYVHVLDIVEAHLLAVDYLEKNPGLHEFNLGKSRGTSNKELLDAFNDITECNLEYEIVERREGDPSFLVSEASKFRIATGYNFPHSNIINIISSQWEWYNNE